MKRRDLMKLAPAAIAVSACPAAASLDSKDSPIAAMHREITRLDAVLNSNHSLTEREVDSLTDQMMDLANAIVDIPARNADDLLHKILGYTVNGNHEIGDGPRPSAIWEEALRIGGVS